MKIIASDFDGTLYIDGTVSEADLRAVSQWRAAGHLFCIVTGRGPGIKQEIDRVGPELDYLVCFNGALILDAAGAMVYRQTAPASLIHALEQLAYACGAQECFSESAQEMADGFGQFSARMDTDENARIYTERVNSDYAGVLTGYQNGCHADIVRAGISKATGVAELAARHAVPGDAIVTVGDNYNDLPMLTAYKGYAVARAPEDIRRTVSRVCESVGELITLLLGQNTGR